MSLRAKFIFLILGIVLLPVLFLGTLLFMQVELGWERSPFDMRLGGIFMTKGLDRRFETHPLALREDGFVGKQIIIGEEGEVLASNSPDYPKNITVDLTTLIREKERDVWFSPLEENRILIQLFDDSMMIKEYLGFHTMQIPIIITTIFVTLMTMILLTSLNRSVRNLSGAMERVAMGDLDFEHKPRRKDNLGSLGQSFESMRRALKEEKARQSRFLMAISHDLKTPIASIRGYTEALADGLDHTPEKRKDFLAIIDEKASVLQNRVGALIDLAKMKTGEWLHKLEDQNLMEVLEDFVQRALQDAKIRGQSLILEGKGSKPFPVKMDRELFERMVENLLQNAFLYGQKGTPAILGWNLEKEQCEIYVRNKGRDIPQESQEKIFEPLYREDQGRNAPGSGLGLASVKHICESHGWTITLESHGGTTTFSVVIPRRG